MADDLRLGFNGEFQVKKVAVAPDDPAPWDPATKFSLVGSRVPRLDGPAKTTGAARYAIDVRLPGLLYGRILRSPLAAATVKSIDLSEAKKLPGVRAALTLAEPGEKIRFAGQEVAAIAADTPERADDALAAIRVSYEPLPFVVTLEDAARPGAPLVFEGQASTKSSAGDMPSGGKSLPREGNVLGPRLTTKGNVAEGFRQADAVVEGTYVTQVQTHNALETHGLVARWEGDELTVWASTQGIFSVRDELAEAMKIPASKVKVITEYMGGGFGAKFGARIEGVTAARLAREAGAPVKLFLDRKEEQLAAGNRPSSVQWIKAGATKDGKLTALHLVVRRHRRNQRRHGDLRPDQEHLRLREPPGGGVRRVHQRRTLGRDAGPRASAGRLRPGSHARRARGQARHGPPRAPHEERPLRGAARGVPDRRREDRLERPRKSAGDEGPGRAPRRRRRGGGLVQHRENGAPGDGDHSPGRLRRRRARGPGSRHGLAHHGRHRGGRRARPPAREGLRPHRRHAHALRPRVRRLHDDAVERPDHPPRGVAGQAKAGGGRGPGVEGPRRIRRDRRRRRDVVRRSGVARLPGRRRAACCRPQAPPPRPTGRKTTRTPGSGSRAARSSPRSRSTPRPARSAWSGSSPSTTAASR